MKKIAFLISIIISTWNLPCFASASMTNAKMVNYIFGRYDYSYFLVIPDNLTEYQYISHYPFTSLLFLIYYDEEKIANLTVKELKSGSLGGTGSCCAGYGFDEALKFDKLKGFEGMADEINRSNEFEIADQKGKILSTLVEIYSKYKEDYKRCLQGVDGTYKFRKGKLKYTNWNKLEDYNKNVEINEPSSWAFYDRMAIEDYDLDEKILTIETLSPISRRSSKGWEYHYIRKFKKKYDDLKYLNTALHGIAFPEEVQIPMSIENAKKLFPEKDKVFCETILTVKLEEGAFGYSGNAFFIMTANFNIIKITKNYFSRKKWSKEENKFIGDPILTIELESNEDHPLH